MSAYLVVRVKITDPESYDKYRARTPAVIAQYGGKFLARGGRSELLEGDNPEFSRSVIIEFPDYEQAQTFYRSPEYQEILKIRLAASESQAVLVEGV